MTPADLGSAAGLWRILHAGSLCDSGLIPLGDASSLMVVNPILPWIGVMALGYAFGPWTRGELAGRRRRLLMLGLALTAAFAATAAGPEIPSGLKNRTSGGRSPSLPARDPRSRSAPAGAPQPEIVMEFFSQIFSQDLSTWMKSTNGMIALAIVALFYVFAFCRVFAKAGFNPMLGFLAFVPPLMFVLPFYLAFAPWPQDRELKGLRRMKKAVHTANEKHERFDKAA